MTHADLVLAAVAWLRGAGRCRVVLAEIVAGSMLEIPDAIGWRLGHFSTLIECKTSRADLLREARKTKTVTRSGVGHRRYILAPVGLNIDGAVPAGWGVLRFDGRKARVAEPAPEREYADGEYANRIRHEMPLLVSAVQRHELGCRWDSKRARFEPYNARRNRENRWLFNTEEPAAEAIARWSL